MSQLFVSGGHRIGASASVLSRLFRLKKKKKKGNLTPHSYLITYYVSLVSVEFLISSSSSVMLLETQAFIVSTQACLF